MKKVILALAVLSMGAMAAFGWTGVLVQWSTTYGVYDHTAVDLTGTSNYALDTYAMTWQLIYSGDNVAGAPDLGNSANGWVSGDDQVFATRTLAQSVGGANVTASDVIVYPVFLKGLTGLTIVINSSYS